MSIRSASLAIALLSHLLLLSLLAAPLQRLLPVPATAPVTLRIQLQGPGETVPEAPPRPPPPARSGSDAPPAKRQPAPVPVPVASPPAPARTRQPPVSPAPRARAKKRRNGAGNGGRSRPDDHRQRQQRTPARPLHSQPSRPAGTTATAPAVARPSRNAADTAPGDTSLEQAEQDYRNRILQLLDAHKRYPLRARRKGLQGQVELVFTLLPDGRLLQQAVARSSGHPVLDRAALATLERIDTFPPFPEPVRRDRWQFRAPLRFTLE